MDLIFELNHFCFSEGSNRSWDLTVLAVDILEMCLSRGIIIQPIRVTSEENLLAGIQYICYKNRMWMYLPFIDAASRRKAVEDWSLSPTIFQKIVEHYGTPDVDLMATTESRKTPFFYSWSRNDSEAVGLDSLSRDVTWNSWSLPYLFPPFSLIPACLNKIQEQKVRKIIVILPYWKGKPWFTQAQKMMVDIKRLPFRKDLVVDLVSNKAPTNIMAMKLVVAVLSGMNGVLEEPCPKRRKISWKQVGGTEQSCSIDVPGVSGSSIAMKKDYHHLPYL